MEDPRREILTRIARGELSPEEGAALLDELEREQAESNGQAATATRLAEPPGSDARTLRRIRVARGFGSIVVTGDEGVREAVAEGPHVAERQGDTLHVKGGDTDEGGFVFDFPGVFSRHERHRAQRGGGRWPWDSFQNYQHQFRALNIRCNPELALEAVSQAGSIRVEGVRGPISAEVQAGTCTIEGFRSPLDLSLQAGSLRGRGILTSGASKIRSEAGSVHLILEQGSNVKVRARSTMGRIVMGHDEPKEVFVLGGGSRELTVGDGSATLDIDATMGSVRVEVR
jgi:hypothetical protein